MTGPLAGIKVIDIGAFSVGPVACSLLALMGAEAIRIEPPNLDGLIFVGTIVGCHGQSYISSHFNKKSIILDIRAGRGKELCTKLIKWADIVVNNRRLGALDKMGFGYDILNKINPRIIYIESTSYGTKGPGLNTQQPTILFRRLRVLLISMGKRVARRRYSGMQPRQT